MAHGSNILHSIKLPNGTVYEIHDAQAVHTLADLAALGMNTEGIFSYQGIVATVITLLLMVANMYILVRLGKSSVITSW